VTAACDITGEALTHCPKATALALQKQFEMEERSSALEESKKLQQPSAEQEQQRHLSAAERHNAFLELSALMAIGDRCCCCCCCCC